METNKCLNLSIELIQVISLGVFVVACDLLFLIILGTYASCFPFQFQFQLELMLSSVVLFSMVFRLLSYIASCTKFLFVENVSASRSTKSAW